MTAAEVIGVRTTADGWAYNFWTDGAIASPNGVVLVGARRGAAQIAAARTAGDWLRGDACLYTANEIARLFRAAYKYALAHPEAQVADLRDRFAFPSWEEMQFVREDNAARRFEAERSHTLHCRDPWCRRCRGRLS